MRYILAVPCVLVSFALLGWINYACYERISDVGINQLVSEITEDAIDTAIFFGCWLVGLGFLAAALALMAPAKRQATN